LDDVCIFDCEGISDCMIKLLLALAYPSVLLCVMLCGSLFCDDHQLVDVSRCEEHPWPTGKWWFRCLVDLTWALLFMSFARTMAHVLFMFHVVFLVTLDIVLVLFDIMVCPRISFYNSWISLGSESLLHISALVIILW